MKFDLISDVHVDMNLSWFRTMGAAWDQSQPFYYNWHTDRKSDLLVIAGDICNDPRVSAKVIREAAGYYPFVLFCDGNHEHYIGNRDSSRTVQINVNQLQDDLLDLSNVAMLTGEETIVLGNTAFIGACGWYDWKAVPTMSRDEQYREWKNDSNDSRCIRYDPDGFPDKLARRDADRLITRVTELQDRPDVEHIAVITHTVPTVRGVVAMGHPWYYLNGSYVNTRMDEVIQADTKKKIKTWCFGHTHFVNDFVHEGINFISNPWGYLGERRDGSQFNGVIQVDPTVRRGSAFEDLPPDPGS